MPVRTQNVSTNIQAACVSSSGRCWKRQLCFCQVFPRGVDSYDILLLATRVWDRLKFTGRYERMLPVGHGIWHYLLWVWSCPCISGQNGMPYGKQIATSVIATAIRRQSQHEATPVKMGMHGCTYESGPWSIVTIHCMEPTRSNEIRNKTINQPVSAFHPVAYRTPPPRFISNKPSLSVDQPSKQSSKLHLSINAFGCGAFTFLSYEWSSFLFLRHFFFTHFAHCWMAKQYNKQSSNHNWPKRYVSQTNNKSKGNSLANQHTWDRSDT